MRAERATAAGRLAVRHPARWFVGGALAVGRVLSQALSIQRESAIPSGPVSHFFVSSFGLMPEAAATACSERA